MLSNRAGALSTRNKYIWLNFLLRTWKNTLKDTVADELKEPADHMETNHEFEVGVVERSSMVLMVQMVGQDHAAEVDCARDQLISNKRQE